jgi:uncharacterized repeat protein (TIGR02543 family)
MQTNINGTQYKKIYVRKKSTDNFELYKKAYVDGVQVYSAGNNVTYYVDAGKVYTEEVEFEASCLSPKTFTPAKNGWVFVGWREDTTASGSVLPSKVMGDKPITLYAVYSKAVTLKYIVAGSTKSTPGTAYYNAYGSTSYPTIKVANPMLSGAVFKGWSVTAGNATVSYGSLTNGIQLSANATVYAIFKYNDVTFATKTGLSNESSTTYETTLATFTDSRVQSISVSISGVYKLDYWLALAITLNGTTIWSVGSIHGNDDLDEHSFSCSGTVASSTATIVVRDGDGSGNNYGDCYVRGVTISATGVGKTIVG